jgi:transcriptional regulator with XRE-family HTH domain
MPKELKVKSVSDVDKYIGQRLRVRRMMLKFIQSDLAEKVGITFQQLQKYENGSNRISASRLCSFSKFLNVPVSYFFDGYEGEDAATGMVMEEAEEFGSSKSADPFMDKDCNKLVMAYTRINDDSLKQKVMELVMSLASLGKNKSIKDD